MRRYTDPDVLQSLKTYFARFPALDIFVSTWSDRGVSHNHGQAVYRGDEKDVVSESVIRQHFPQVRGVRIHDSAVWEAQLRGAWKTVYEEGFEWNGMQIRGTVVPQLFTLWDANEMRKAAGASHDVVIRVRPDVLFRDHSRSLYDSVAPNTIYAINNRRTGTFYPQRIYDIFFFGTADAMDGVCEAYRNFDRLIEHPWQNGLHTRDACRCLYVQARFFGCTAVVDLDVDVCAVKR